MSKYKNKKPSLVEFTKQYSNNQEACYQFFFHIKYPNGFICKKCKQSEYKMITRGHACVCEKCHYQDCLFSGTIFQDNKLPVYKLLLGIFLFFTSNKGISAMEMRSQLDVNYKTALLLLRKCRILMKESNDSHILDAMFYEADTAYIGAKSKDKKCQRMGTEKQAFLAVLSTKKENRFPQYMKLYPILKDTGNIMDTYITKATVLSTDRTLNTDAKNTFNVLKEKVNLKAEVIDYTDENHKLHWLNTVISNTKNQILGIYHGVSKRDLPLFLAEQEYRFNHRNVGDKLIDKITKYLTNSHPCPRKTIIRYLDELEPSFNRQHADSCAV